MAIVAGIDEAGFGPVMGPLVVSATAFDVPDALANQSMWQSLAGCVCRTPSARRRSLIPITDSKKLYSGLRGAKGLDGLERGVLAMASAAGQNPRTLRELFSWISPAAIEQASACPWYRELDLPLPHCIQTDGVILDGKGLSARMAKMGMSVRMMRSEPVLETEYNRLVEACNNKSSLLFDISSRLLAAVWECIPAGQNAIIVLDHQGGRVRYLEGLQRVLPGCRYKINDETETCSDYTISDDRRTARVQFLVQGDDRHLPVSLAAMLSKYVRELMMVLLNRYWTTHLPDISPTAGYFTDGKRFWQEIMPVVSRMGLDASSVYRCR